MTIEPTNFLARNFNLLQTTISVLTHGGPKKRSYCFDCYCFDCL